MPVRSLTARLALLALVLAVAPVVVLRLARSPESVRVRKSATAPATYGSTGVRVIHVFHGWTASELAGPICAPASDVDGDGCADLLLATWGDEGMAAGEVALVSGRTGLRLASGAAPTEGTGPAAIRAFGDFDNDGARDVLVGTAAPDQPALPGFMWLPKIEIWIFSGRDARPLSELTSARDPRAWFLSASFLAAADRTSDGLPEVLVAAPGEVRILSGADGSPLGEVPDVQPRGEPPSVASGEDLDGDGAVDFAVGGNARVRVLSGVDSTVLLELEPGADERDADVVVPALVPDLDGDGVPDVLVGHPQCSPSMLMMGRVRAFSGATGAFLYAVDGTALMANFGTSITGVGDVDGDGLEDFAVGAPGAPLAPTSGGTFVVSTIAGITIHSGADGSLLTRLQPPTPGTLFGAHVTRVGDVDGDGVRDLVIEEPGAEGTDESGNDWKGATWVLSGATLK